MFCEGTRDYDSSFTTSKQVVEAVSARRSVIRKDELKPGTKYTVYVKATTVKGDGTRSDPVILHTPSKGMRDELGFTDMKCSHFLVPCRVLNSAFLKILHWRPEFHNWSPAGDCRPR